MAKPFSRFLDFLFEKFERIAWQAFQKATLTDFG
jgi:hypothetical protein